MEIASLQSYMSSVEKELASKGLESPEVYAIAYTERTTVSVIFTLDGERKHKVFTAYGQGAIDIGAVDAYVLSIKSADEQRKKRFLETLALAIECGKQADYDIGFLSVLRDMLASQSEGLIEHIPTVSTAPLSAMRDDEVPF